MGMEMDIDGFLSNCKGDLNDTLRKVKELFTDNGIEFVDDEDDEQEGSIALRWIRGLHGDTEFLVDTIKHNMKLWDAEREKLTPKLRPMSEWHDDMGDVLCFKVPIDEPPRVTSPLSTQWQERGWDNYYTHFTKIQVPSQEGL